MATTLVIFRNMLTINDKREKSWPICYVYSDLDKSWPIWYMIYSDQDKSWPVCYVYTDRDKFWPICYVISQGKSVKTYPVTLHRFPHVINMILISTIRATIFHTSIFAFQIIWNSFEDLAIFHILAKLSKYLNGPDKNPTCEHHETFFVFSVKLLY